MICEGNQAKLTEKTPLMLRPRIEPSASGLCCTTLPAAATESASTGARKQMSEPLKPIIVLRLNRKCIYRAIHKRCLVIPNTGQHNNYYKV